MDPVYHVAAGNPTNIIVSMAYRLGFLEYSKWMALPTIGTKPCILNAQPHGTCCTCDAEAGPACVLCTWVCVRHALHCLTMMVSCLKARTQPASLPHQYFPACTP
jgi:hypothetical protein